jgi:hypothetical protein
MLISDKQQEANQQNAKHSTGPKTPEGKAAVRLNALTYGLRARSLLIPGEDPEEYKQLWNDLVADWQPQNRTERLHLEQMSTSQWLLARVAFGENDIYQQDMPAETQSALLRSASTERTRLERSFTTAMRELKQLQKERQAQRQQPVQPKQAVQAVQAPVQQPAYLMSEGTEDHPVFCAPITPDSR